MKTRLAHMPSTTLLCMLGLLASPLGCDKSAQPISAAAVGVRLHGDVGLLYEKVQQAHMQVLELESKSPLIASATASPIEDQIYWMDTSRSIMVDKFSSAVNELRKEMRESSQSHGQAKFREVMLHLLREHGAGYRSTFLLLEVSTESPTTKVLRLIEENNLKLTPYAIRMYGV